ncbi:hypothetical protein CS542_02030 [Pedobacter sp. IW39]|nr:hypothetical protein CS542_02030 [Pedobacter sp. IW39]
MFNMKRISQTKKTITGKVRYIGPAASAVVVAAVNKPNQGTQTDNNGKYVLDVPPGTLLRFSYVGIKNNVSPLANLQYH